jgi:putative membrane protein
MLLVFRTNSSYDRWWEARKVWGSLVNNSRGIAIKLNGLLPKENTEERQRLVVMISKLAFILKEHLRGSASPVEVILPEPYGKNWMKSRNHLPNSVCLALTEEIHGLKKKNLLNDSHLIYLSDEIKTFSDVIGACERIKNTPIPFSYSLFIKKAFANDLKYWAIPVVSLIFYAFVGLEVIAEEIEEPFGKDTNDLPTDALAEKIHKDVEEILLKI